MDNARYDVLAAGKELLELATTADPSCTGICPVWHMMRGRGLSPTDRDKACGTADSCNAAHYHGSELPNFKASKHRVDERAKERAAGALERGGADTRGPERGGGRKGGRGTAGGGRSGARGAGRGLTNKQAAGALMGLLAAAAPAPGRAEPARVQLAEVAFGRSFGLAPPPPQPCLGPLNEPLDVVVCASSAVLVRRLEAEGAGPGSVLTIDFDPPELPGTLHFQGDARRVLYKRRWRRLYGFAPCDDTAESGLQTTAAAKLADGRTFRGVAFYVWVFCAPADAAWMEHPISCVSRYWRVPDQTVSPHQFGDTFVHPRTQATHGFKKTTEVRSRGFPLLAADPALAAADPLSYGPAQYIFGGGPAVVADVRVARSRSPPLFMQAIAEQLTVASILPHEPPVYAVELERLRAKFVAIHGSSTLPMGWDHPQAAAPPWAVKGGSDSKGRQHRLGATFLPYSGPIDGPDWMPASSCHAAATAGAGAIAGEAGALPPRGSAGVPAQSGKGDSAPSGVDEAARARRRARFGADGFGAPIAASGAAASPNAPTEASGEGRGAASAPTPTPTIASPALAGPDGAPAAGRAPPRGHPSPHRKWARSAPPSGRPLALRQGMHAARGVGILSAPAVHNDVPRLSMAALSGCGAGRHIAIVPISVAETTMVALPGGELGAELFGFAQGTRSHDAAFSHAESLLASIVSSPRPLQALPLAEMAIGDATLVVVAFPAPLALDGRALASGGPTQWATAEALPDGDAYLVVCAAIEHTGKHAVPSPAARMAADVGKGRTCWVAGAHAMGARALAFDERLRAIEGDCAALCALLLSDAERLEATDARRASFLRQAAGAARPLPVGEIPAALTEQVFSFSSPELALLPYSYRSVIPFTDPAPSVRRPVTEWPAGVEPPTCEADFYTEDAFEGIYSRLEAFDAWHADGIAGRPGARPPPIVVGLEGVRERYIPMMLAGAIIDWTVSPPALLGPDHGSFKPHQDGARAAELFADTTDKEIIDVWRYGTHPPVDFDREAICVAAPPLLAGYKNPEGVRKAAAEHDAFRNVHGWSELAAIPRSRERGSLGLTSAPFWATPSGDVPKANGGIRIIDDFGFPRQDVWVGSGPGRHRLVSHNERHGPSRPSPGTDPHVRGDAPRPRETKPDIAEGCYNSSIVNNGCEAAGIPRHELAIDGWKSFHQYHYLWVMRAYMCGLLPTLVGAADGSDLSEATTQLAPHLVPTRRLVTAMGWGPMSAYCQRAENVKNRAIMLRVDAWDDEQRANGLLTDAELSWLDARSSLPHGDYGRQDRFCALSSYSDDPRAVSGGNARTVALVNATYDVCGPPGINYLFAEINKWFLGCWSAWLGMRTSSALGVAWLPPAKALRASQDLHSIATGTAPLDDFPRILSFASHVVYAVRCQPYPLVMLWRYYDSLQIKAADTSMPPGGSVPSRVVTACNKLRTLVINCPGTSMLTAVTRRYSLSGTAVEWLVQSDACFDVVKTRVQAADGTVRVHVAAGDKDPPGMGGDLYGRKWHYAFTDAQLQYWNIPPAEFIASILSLILNDHVLEVAECVMLEVDALATPHTLVERARSPSMIAVHEEFMSDPIFRKYVLEKQNLGCRHRWGRFNKGGDATSRGRRRVAEALDWQLGRRTEYLTWDAHARTFFEKVDTRLRQLHATSPSRDVAAPGGDAIRHREVTVVTLGLTLAALFFALCWARLLANGLARCSAPVGSRVLRLGRARASPRRGRLLAALALLLSTAPPSAAVALPRPRMDPAAPGGDAMRYSMRRTEVPYVPPPRLTGACQAPCVGFSASLSLVPATRPAALPALTGARSASAAGLAPLGSGSPDGHMRSRQRQQAPRRAVALPYVPPGVPNLTGSTTLLSQLVPRAQARPRPPPGPLRLTLARSNPMAFARTRRATPLLFADTAGVPVDGEAGAPGGRPAAYELVARRDISQAGLARVEDLVRLMSFNEAPWALRPSSPGRLRTLLSALVEAQEDSAPDSTLNQERSNFKYWNAYCAEWGTTPARPHAASLNSDDLQVECAFWGAFIPWCHERMPSKAGILGEAQPQSCLAVARGIKRAMARLGIITVPLTAAVRACEGLLRRYIEDHGPESLIPHRKEPLTQSIIDGLLSLGKRSEVRIGRRVLDWQAPGWASLRAMYHTLAQTGFRKSEVSLHEKVAFGNNHLSMHNVTWLIGGLSLSSPTATQLQSLQRGDYALLRPPPSKSDQFSLHWGASTIYLPFDPDARICAARELAREEIRRQVPPQARKRAPLFVGFDDASPWRHGALNAIFYAMMVLVVGQARAGFYSMHSWRIYLACALLAAGASNGTIQTMLRWRSDDALKIYARINDDKYAGWLESAACAPVSSVRTTTALADALRQAQPMALGDPRHAAFQMHWQRMAAAAPAGAEALAGTLPPTDDSARVAAIDGALGALLRRAEAVDAEDAA